MIEEEYYLKLTKIINAYLFLELYKADVIKSKSFTFSDSGYVLKNKLMHILKTNIKKKSNQPEYANLISDVSFRYKTLFISLNIEQDSQNLTNFVNGWLQSYINNMDILNNFCFINFRNLIISFNFTYSVNLRDMTRIDRNDFSIKSKLDYILNGILYINNTFLDLLFVEVQRLNRCICENTNLSFYDFRMYMQNRVRGNNDIKNFLDILDRFILLNTELSKTITFNEHNYSTMLPPLNRYENYDTIKQDILNSCQANGIILNPDLTLNSITNENIIYNDITI